MDLTFFSEMDRCTVIFILAALPLAISITTSKTSKTVENRYTYEPKRDVTTEATNTSQITTSQFNKKSSASAVSQAPTADSSLVLTTLTEMLSNAYSSDVKSLPNFTDETLPQTTDSKVVRVTAHLHTETHGSDMPTTSQSGEEVFCGDDWSAFGNLCFHLALSINPGKNFADSEYVCRRIGGHLSSIHSDVERQHILDYIMTEIRKEPNFFTNNISRDSVWMGLTTRDSLGYHYTDGSALDYRGEAFKLLLDSNFEEGGVCVSIVPFPGDFTIDSCSTEKHGALCKSKGVRLLKSNSTVVIESPNYPGNYNNRVTEKYLIQAPQGLTVCLTFETFQLDGVFPDCSFDSLIVYDGNTTSNTVLAQLCGENVPAPLNSSSNEMFLTFVSDGFVNRQGFRAIATFLPFENNNRRISPVLLTVVITVVFIIAAIIVALLGFRLLATRNNRNFRKRSEKNVIHTYEGRFTKNNLEVIVEDRNEISMTDVREFPRSRLSIKACIGKGAFAFVYKAKAVGILPSNDITPVAVKMLKESVTDKERQDFLNELKILSRLKHPNVVSFYGFCKSDEDSVCLIMEYLKNGNLLQYLRSFSDEQRRLSVTRSEEEETMITSKQLMHFGLEIANGMAYLASKKLVHRDLAARNILLGDNLECKVSDLGLARILKYSNEYEMKSKSRVPIRWMSPESILRNTYSTASDVWSFGVVLWEVATLGSHPYPGLGSTQIIQDIKKGIRLPQPTHCRDEIYSIMTTSWEYHPSDRPGFPDLKIKLDKMLEQEMEYFVMENFKEDDYVYIEEEESIETDTFEIE